MSDDMIETINNTDEMGRSSSEEGEMDGEARPADTPEQIAHELAGSQSVAKRGRRAPPLTGYLPRQEALLRQAYRHFVEASESRRVLSYAAEWLLDNFYVVLQAIRQVREDMPRTYYAQLPRLDGSALAGYPRVYTIAHAIIASSEGYLDTTHALLFIRAYQDVSPLTMGELWALPTMLRIAFIESLARAIVQIAEIEPPAGAWPDAGPRDAVHSLTAEAVVVNGIMSLRTLATQDWKTFFESASPVEKILQSDPIDIYAQMDFATRDRYRKAVEQLARAASQDELVVARTAIQLADSALHTKRVGLHTTQEAEAAPGKRLPKTQRVSWREAHVGFYLVGAGFAHLEAELGHRPTFGKRMRRWLSKHAFPAYMSVIFLLAVVLVLGALWYAHSGRREAPFN